MDKLRIETGVGPMTDNIVNSIVDKVNSDAFKKNVSSKVLVPLSQAVSDKVRPYLYWMAFLYAILLVLLIVIIVMLVKMRKKM